MKAVDKYVLVEPIYEEQVSQGGLLKGEPKDLRFKKAKVISCNNISCTDGDLILYDSFSASGHKAIIDGKPYILLTAGDVAIIL